MKRSSSVILWVSVALGSTNLFPATTDPEIAALTGTWRGQSICATDAPACHNETVVCYIKQIPNRTDVVFIQADKLVDGKGDHDGRRRVAVSGHATQPRAEDAAAGLAPEHFG